MNTQGPSEIQNLQLSVVVPVYRGQDSAPILFNNLKTYFESSHLRYEVIFVVDGSPDDSFLRLRELAKVEPNLKLISFTKNFGQISATMAGYREATGKYVVCMDDDLQNKSSDVANIIAALSDDVDVVFAVPKNPVHTLWRSLGSKLNDWIATLLIGKPKGLRLSSFIAVKKEIAKECAKYEGSYPYLAGLILRVTRSCVNMEVVYDKRKFGTSNYTLTKLIRLWLNGFTNFSVVPLRIAGVCGVAISLGGFALGIFIIISKLSHPEIQAGWTSLFAATLFVSGIQLLFLGLLGEYVGRLFMLANKSPQYSIRHRINCSTEHNPHP